MEKRGKNQDYVLASIVLILILLGIVIITSVSAAISQEKFGTPYTYLLRHLLFGIVPGLFFGLIVYRIPLDFWKKWALVILLANLLLMALVFMPRIGINAGGASRWINLGFTSLQPSEFLKFSLIIYLAVWLPSLKGRVLAFLAVIGVIAALLILQPNVSTLGIIVLCGLLMYFASGTPAKHTLGIVLGGLALLTLLVKISPYRLERIMVFFKPEIEPMGMSYQLKQALIAVGSGGIWGKGLGLSLQRFGVLPQPMADSIFAIFSEETGFIGALVLIILFLILAWRGFKIAGETGDSFSKLAVLGVTSWITVQAFVNMGTMVGIMPLTGIPLPFVSYGGSAMAAELMGIGLLLNISKK